MWLSSGKAKKFAFLFNATSVFFVDIKCTVDILCYFQILTTVDLFCQNGLEMKKFSGVTVG